MTSSNSLRVAVRSVLSNSFIISKATIHNRNFIKAAWQMRTPIRFHGTKDVGVKVTHHTHDRLNDHRNDENEHGHEHEHDQTDGKAADDEDEMEDMFIAGPSLGKIEWRGPTRGGARPEPTRYGDWE